MAYKAIAMKQTCEILRKVKLVSFFRIPYCVSAFLQYDNHAAVVAMAAAVAVAVAGCECGCGWGYGCDCHIQKLAHLI